MSSDMTNKCFFILCTPWLLLYMYWACSISSFVTVLPLVSQSLWDRLCLQAVSNLDLHNLGLKPFRFGYGSEVRMRWKSWFPSQISSRFLKSCNCKQILAISRRQKVKNSSLWAESWQSKACLFSSIAGGFNDSFTPSLYNFLCNPSFAESASRVWNPKPKKKGHSVFFVCCSGWIRTPLLLFAEILLAPNSL